MNTKTLYNCFSSKKKFIYNFISKPSFFWRKLAMILMMKKRVSTILMSEKPVRSPMVPPMGDSLSIDLAFWSWIMSCVWDVFIIPQYGSKKFRSQPDIKRFLESLESPPMWRCSPPASAWHHSASWGPHAVPEHWPPEEPLEKGDLGAGDWHCHLYLWKRRRNRSRDGAGHHIQTDKVLSWVTQSHLVGKFLDCPHHVSCGLMSAHYHATGYCCLLQ